MDGCNKLGHAVGYRGHRAPPSKIRACRQVRGSLHAQGKSIASYIGSVPVGNIRSMGYDSERAAMIYQHEARGADKAITDAIDTHVEDEKRRDDGQGGATGTAN